MRFFVTMLLIVVGFFYSFSQEYSIKGFVHDADNNSYLAAASISLMPSNTHGQADKDGGFFFGGLSPGNYILSVGYIGYDDLFIPLTLLSDTLLHIHLSPARVHLQEVVINGSFNGDSEIITPVPVKEVGRGYLSRHNSGSLMQTLSAMPGIASMDIGSGFSKPVIRGLAFNRVAVVDRGIVQQNQQWGADHGLEIDQYDVDRVRIHRGPMSLLRGSDAIGGVIEILPPSVPEEDMVRGEVVAIAKSNNNLLGTSMMINRKKGDWFLRARVTVQDYGDYRIPADTINYLSWNMPVYGRRMKNTAGREYNMSMSANYDGDMANTWLHLSNVNGKNGFFPGSHGIPSLDRLDPDGSTRNIEHPYAGSNHLKVVLNRERRFATGIIAYDIGYQQNKREERSAFHTHYGRQKPPEVSPDLELRFMLDTWSANVLLSPDDAGKWSRDIGVSAEYQDNRVGGYSFLLPEFDRLTAGVYWLNRIKLSDSFLLSGGIRYDVGRLNVQGYYDPLLEEYLEDRGVADDVSAGYAQRASQLQRSFGDFSGSLGFHYILDSRQSLKMNFGKSFRYPSANELSSNGMHHGAFRHEKGNTELNPEYGYQLDMQYRYEDERWHVEVSPFLTYFPNYIFLEPSGQWSLLPHAGQVYAYRQSEAMMAGGEVEADYNIDQSWRISANVEYLYNRNLDDKYPLPFSPPTVVGTELAYTGNGGKKLTYYEIRVENRWVMAQNRIAKNEDKTPGTNLWNVSAHFHWKVGGRRIVTDLRVDNLLDRAFLNHLSFYRKLNAPEPGRNFQIIVRFPF